MADQPAAPPVCSRCNAPVGKRSVTVIEREAASTVVSDWTLCSWACAGELVNRFVRLGRDER